MGEETFAMAVCPVDPMWEKLKMNPLAWLIWTIDFAIWLVYFVVCGWVFALKRKLAGSPGKAVQMPDGQWRGSWGTSGIPPLITEPAKGVNTGWKVFDRACDILPRRRLWALGSSLVFGARRRVTRSRRRSSEASPGEPTLNSKETQLHLAADWSVWECNHRRRRAKLNSKTLKIQIQFCSGRTRLQSG